MSLPACAGALLLASAATASGPFARAGSATPMQDGASTGSRLAAPGTDLGPAVMAVDGRPAAAGRVPDGIGKAPTALWNKLIVALTPAAAVAESRNARSFELVFDGRIRSETGSNDYRAQFGYLEQGPGLVRAIMLDKRGRPKSIQTRGLGAGDRAEYWFKKLTGDTKSDWIELTRSDHREDRTETDRWANISYDIARLTDPASFRIVDLKLRRIKKDSQRIEAGILDFENDPGVKLPDTDVNGIVDGRGASLGAIAKDLVWLELATPDFKDLSNERRSRRQRQKDLEAGKEPEVRRLVFGIDPKTSRPQLVIVAPHRTDMPLQVPGSLLVQCTDWILSGPEGKPRAYVPGRFLAYETEPTRTEEESATGLRRRFSNGASADLYLSELSNMNAQLKREDFLPQ